MGGMDTRLTITAGTDPDRAAVDDADSSAAHADEAAGDADAPVLSLEVESGPAVDAVAVLGARRYVIGRARGVAVRLDDPEVEPHHAMLDVASDGTVTLMQLAGRVPIMVGGVPVVGRVGLAIHDRVDVGSTRLRLAPPPPRAGPPHTGEVPGDPWRRMLVRSPRAVPFLAVAAVEAPACERDGQDSGDDGPHAGMLVGAVGGVAGGLVMAAVTGSAMMAVFGLVAAMITGASWLVGRVRSARARRRRRHRQRDELEVFSVEVAEASRRFRAHHVETVPTVARRLTAVDHHELWSRRSEHGDAFVVTLGHGDVEHSVAITGPDAGSPTRALDPDLAAVADRHRSLLDVPVPVALDARDRHVVAVEGGGAWGVVRSLVLQLAIGAGPADWCLRAVVAEPAAHRWIERLPQASSSDGRAVVVGGSDAAAVADAVVGLDDGDDRRVIVVCDVPSLLATRTGPLRRLLDGDRRVTVLLVVDGGDAEDPAVLPAVCSSAIRLGGRGAARWIPDLHDAAALASWGTTRVRVAGVSTRVAERIAQQLDRYVDPEDPSSSSTRLPSSLRLVDLPGVPSTVDAVAAAWSSGDPDPAPAAVVGMSVDGVIEIDLVRDGPHGLVAGTTGSGKSELLRTLVVSLAARLSPSQLSLVLVDYKGGSTFDACASLPHTVGLVTDLDDGLAARALVSLEAELHRRERILREHRATDLAAYRALRGVAPIARLVVVIDEFAAMAKELPSFLSSLVGIAQRGRSLGIHLVLATQRPAGVIDDAIRANTNLRLALRLHDVADAMDVVGDRTPATFGRGVPGRAMLRLGPDDVVEFQTAAEPDLDALVATIRDAAARLGTDPPHRPWLPPLSETSDLPVERGAVGIVDDPAGQCRRPLRWSASANLALVGALGSGTTTSMVALALALTDESDGAELCVIDGRGDAALDVVDRLTTCAGVARLHEHERIDRMLQRLVGRIDRRRAGTDTGPVAVSVLLVDGIGALRRSLDEPARAASMAALERILAEGPAVGVVTAAVVDADGGATGTVIARFAERWVFHLSDPTTGSLMGVSPAQVPPAVPGRIVEVSSGLEAQVRAPSTALVDRLVQAGHERGSDRSAVSRIEVLAATVRATDLVPDVATDPAAGTPVDALVAVDLGRSSVDAQSAGTPVGRRYDDLGVAELELTGGERLVIAGPSRSGRSTLLSYLMSRWRLDHPHGTVAVVCGSPRSSLAEASTLHTVGDLVDLAPLPGQSDAPLLVVVDDAERVDDELGVLARLAGQRSGGTTTMYLAARADALRSAYDHWAAAARRQRFGFVMAATDELDADVLGTPPPRRCPIAPRPGLAWMIAQGDCTLVQTVLTP